MYVFARYIVLRPLMLNQCCPVWFERFSRSAFEFIFVWVQFGGGVGAFAFALTHHSYEAFFMPGMVMSAWGAGAMKAFRDFDSRTRIV